MSLTKERIQVEIDKRIKVRIAIKQLDEVDKTIFDANENEELVNDYHRLHHEIELLRKLSKEYY